MVEMALRHVYKKYDNAEKYSVTDFNLEIADREFIVFVGPSGCGKSTTLRMIAGLEDISEGELLIGDKVMNDVAPKDRDIAMVFQNYALYPHMTVFDNMAFGLKLRKYDKAEIKKRVENAAQILGLSEYLDRKPAALSGGQRQRVALGRAIVRDAKVFLMDEPLSNLDAKLRVAMRAEIAKLHQRLNTTTIYVTHDQTEAMTMADRIVIMKDGFVQQIGSPKEVYDTPVNLFVAGFIGSPPMNFIVVDVVKDNGKTYLVSPSFRLETTEAQAKFLSPYVGKKVTFGIRPEDVEYSHQSQDGKTINGNVSVVEPLGSETQVYVATDNANIVGKIDPSVIPTVGEKVALIVNMDKARFFDVDTELRIR